MTNQVELGLDITGGNLVELQTKLRYHTESIDIKSTNSFWKGLFDPNPGILIKFYDEPVSDIKAYRDIVINDPDFNFDKEKVHSYNIDPQVYLDGELSFQLYGSDSLNLKKYYDCDASCIGLTEIFYSKFKSKNEEVGFFDDLNLHIEFKITSLLFKLDHKLVTQLML